MFDFLFNLPRSYKIFIIILSDIIVINLSLIFSFLIYFRLNFFFYDELYYLISITIPSLIILYFSNLKKQIIHQNYVTYNYYLFINTLIFIFGFIISNYLTDILFKSKSLYAIFISAIFISTINIGLLRLFIINIYKKYNSKKKFSKSVAIYGTGTAGINLYNYLSENPNFNVKFFVDDDEDKVGLNIKGLNIYDKNALFREKDKIDLLFIAIFNISNSRKYNIITSCLDKNIKLKTINPVVNINNDIGKKDYISDINLIDLLNRDVVFPNKDLIEKNINSKVVLITGAGGSIGSALCKVISKHKPKKIIALDWSELALFNLRQYYLDSYQVFPSNIKVCAGNITDSQFINNLFKNEKIDTVFHAAAYKHVWFCEENYDQSILNNVYGSLVLFDAVKKFETSNIILISTDKAVSPTSVMGKTKRFVELMLEYYFKNTKKINYSIVRFGNVLGSSGSVVKVFEKQIRENKPIVITDPNVSRFFMTIEEAAELVIQAGSIVEKDRIFFLDMGKEIKILDLAKKIIKLKNLDYHFEDTSSEYINNNSVLIKFSRLGKGEKISEIFYQKPEYELTLHQSIFVLRNDLSNKNMFNVVDKLKKEKYISSEILDGFVVD